MSQKGDNCQKQGCGGQLVVRTSRQVGDTQEQYLYCNRCGQSAGSCLVPSSRIIRRPERV